MKRERLQPLRSVEDSRKPEIDKLRLNALCLLRFKKVFVGLFKSKTSTKSWTHLKQTGERFIKDFVRHRLIKRDGKPSEFHNRLVPPRL